MNIPTRPKLAKFKMILRKLPKRAPLFHCPCTHPIKGIENIYAIDTLYNCTARILQSFCSATATRL